MIISDVLEVMKNCLNGSKNTQNELQKSFNFLVLFFKWHFLFSPAAPIPKLSNIFCVHRNIRETGKHNVCPHRA